MIWFAIYGTGILRKQKTEAGIGYLLGLSYGVAQLCFLLFIVFAGYAQEAREGIPFTSEDEKVAIANDWTAAFSFFIFFIVACFTVVLYQYRSAIIVEVKGTPLPDNRVDDRVDDIDDVNGVERTPAVSV